MSKLHLSRLAEADLIEIWEYVADDNLEAADSLVSQLRSQARLIATQPRIGKERFDLASELRSFALGEYVLFYRPMDRTGISLVRVLHGRRDITRTMFSGV